MLGTFIRISPIRGLALPASLDELKVVQYADDTTIVSIEADFSSHYSSPAADRY